MDEPRQVTTQEMLESLLEAQALVIANLANALAQLAEIDPRALGAAMQTMSPHHETELVRMLAQRMQRSTVLVLFGAQPPAGQA